MRACVLRVAPLQYAFALDRALSWVAAFMLVTALYRLEACTPLLLRVLDKCKEAEPLHLCGNCSGPGPAEQGSLPGKRLVQP